MRCAEKPLTSWVRTAFCHTLKNEPYQAKGEAELCPIDGEKNHWDMMDRARYYRENVSVRTPDEVEWMAQFYREFEDWLDEVRQQK